MVGKQHAELSEQKKSPEEAAEEHIAFIQGLSPEVRAQFFQKCRDGFAKLGEQGQWFAYPYSLLSETAGKRQL